ncbi:MAG: endonuclease/exonuclease/phosphatase [Bacteroidales bacterium]|nr:endonuclease/exonuclease/phosphatase [Bacteroidales bacterium]
MQQHYISWWNLENLFNEENDPTRSVWLQSKLKSELKGWNTDVLSKKLSQLATVIQLMNEGKGPDILGVCEVENKAVLEKLLEKLSSLERNYGIVLHDGEDKRGIDVAFIYDKDKFIAAEQFTHRVVKRNATRDIFQVNFKTPMDKDLVIIGNHWPARMPGTYESDPYRIIAGETLSYWLKRITEIMGDDIGIIAMGDFNDEPFSRSMTDYALSTNNKLKVLYSRTSPRLYNLMATDIAEGIGSYYYSGPFLFDQLLVSKGLIKSTAPLKVVDGSAKVNNYELMAKGSYKAPRRFGRPSRSSSYDPEGFSDHFSVSMLLEEK